MATLLFLTLALMAFIFLLASFFIGGDHDVDHSFDHDPGVEHEYSTVSLFSPKVMGIFVLAFGCVGGACSIYNLNILLSTAIGLLGGFALGGAAWFALNLLHRQQANSVVSAASLIGCTGSVTTRIPPGGVGEVTYLANGMSDTALASAVGTDPLPTGTRVQIVGAGGSALVVKPV